MKKTTLCKTAICILLTLSLAFSLAACGKEDTPALDAPVAEEAAETPSGLSNTAVAIHDQIISPIARGEFDKAYDVLEEYFSENSWESLDGIYLYAYYEDLTILLNMSDVDRNLYHDVFQSFNTPECFLSAMIYYPFFAKQFAYVRDNALVLLPETNDVSFSTSEKLTDDEFNEIYLAVPDAKSAERRSVYMDGIEYETTIIKLENGTYRMWDTTTNDPSSYMMSVAKWKSLE